MSGTVWTRFFWSDWDSDPALRLCSFAAQGLWMRMLCIAATHDPVGYVGVAGRPLDASSIARMSGGEEAEVDALLRELERNGVFSRDRRGQIYSRRMLRDVQARAIARRNGLKGGNPSLCKDEGKSAPLKPRAGLRDKRQSPHSTAREGKPQAGFPSPAGLDAGAHADGAPPSAGSGRLSSFRAVAAARWGEAFAASYVDPAAWDEAGATLTARTSTAADRLRRDLRRELQAAQITVNSPAAASPAKALPPKAEDHP